MSTSKKFMKTEVVVIGGGCAGLMAARGLARAGRRVTLIEARSRLGGRILTEDCNGIPVELGAEFIHGRPPVLLELLRELQLPFFESGGKFYRVRQGKITRGDEETDFGGRGEGDDPFAALKDLDASATRDMTFARAARDMSPAMTEEQRGWLTRYVEGFNAADAGRISAASLKVQQIAEDAIDSDSSYRPTYGYKSMIDGLAQECRDAGVEFAMATPARSILWQRGEVVVACDAQEFHAARCIVTLPVGVLKSGEVMFQPRPDEFFAALDAVEMGDARRISLLFDSPFWLERAPKLSFLIDGEEDSALNAWWSPHPEPWPLLTGWVGGPRALNITSAEELLAGALAALSRYFGETEPELRRRLRSWHTHDWHTDEYARGAYSYVVAGGLPGLPLLAEPVEGTLFFAGEHTEQEGHWGTVHAALSSGLRAAEQVLKSA